MMVSLSESSSVTSDFSASSSSATASSLTLSSSSSSARAAAKAEVRGGFSGCLSSETAAADPLGFLGFLVVVVAAAVAAVAAVVSSESTTLRFRPRPLPTLTSLGSSGDEEDEVSWACSAPFLGPLFDGIEGVPSSFVAAFGFRPFLAGVG